jgi:hypothetical protein
MTGNNTGERMTATQAGIQQQQGVSGVDDKKGDIATIFGEATLYALGLCMENWPSGKAFRITEDEDDFEWVDVRDLANIPEMVPADESFKKRYRQKFPNSKNEPKFMQLEYEEEEQDEEGNPIYDVDEYDIPKFDENNQQQKRIKRIHATKQIDLDVSASIGEGLPTNKMALYNIILTLAQLQLPDERTGQLRPLLSYAQVKKMVEDYLGIKIEDPLEDMDKFASGLREQMGLKKQGQPGPVNMSPDIPGANQQGRMGGVVA